MTDNKEELEKVIAHMRRNIPADATADHALEAVEQAIWAIWDGPGIDWENTHDI